MDKAKNLKAGLEILLKYPIYALGANDDNLDVYIDDDEGVVISEEDSKKLEELNWRYEQWLDCWSFDVM